VIVTHCLLVLSSLIAGSWCLVALKLKVVNLSAVPLMITVMQICESVMGLGMCCVSLHHNE
jgi:hypothetical protein